MTNSSAKSHSVIFGTVGMLGILLAVATAQDTSTIVRETFTQTAERWGLWAALSVGLTAISVGGLIVVVRFTIGTMRDCIDDNTLSNLHVAHCLTKRPCMHDSDQVVNAKALAEDQTQLGATARKVLARRAHQATKS